MVGEAHYLWGNDMVPLLVGLLIFYLKKGDDSWDDGGASHCQSTIVVSEGISMLACPAYAENT